MNVSPAERTAKRLKALPMRLHHHAYTTDNHEETRQFYEDVLGIPLTAMYVEREFIDGEWVELGLAFYEMGDGSALAFFSFADPEKQAAWRATEQSQVCPRCVSRRRSHAARDRGARDAGGRNAVPDRPRRVHVALSHRSQRTHAGIRRR